MDKGFTLVEMLIAVAISGVIMTGVFSAFKTQQDSYLAQEQVAEMQQNIRAGFYVMADELRMAGYDIDKNGDKAGTAGITAASAISVTFTLVADGDGVNNDGDGPTDETGELKTIKYDHYDANSTDDLDHWDLGRQVGAAASTKRAVAENIEQLEFYYTLADGTQILAPTASQLSDIEMLTVSILAITGRADRNYTNNKFYCPASNPLDSATGDCTNPAGKKWGPYGDNSRRRFQTMTVKCRNMGL